MVGVHDLEKPTGLTLPRDIWSLYVAEATAGDPILGFPRFDRREFVPLNREYRVSSR